MLITDRDPSLPPQLSVACDDFIHRGTPCYRVTPPYDTSELMFMVVSTKVDEKMGGV